MTELCPLCGAVPVEVHAKLVCPKCHALVQNCCGD